MDLTDLKFSIKDAGISSSDGELTISEVSGILSGVINNDIADAKTILTVTAIDGQSTDIEVNWKVHQSTLTVSGFDGEYSVLNGIYDQEIRILPVSVYAQADYLSSGIKTIDLQKNEDNTVWIRIESIAGPQDPDGQYFYILIADPVDNPPTIIGDFTTVNSIEFEYNDMNIKIEINR